MKAIILSAGQGRRLSPLTDKSPKCALRLHGKTLIEWQIDELAKCGVDDITVVLGYAADRVEQLLARRYGQRWVRGLHNPFFEVSDNLASCWLARAEMIEDFILLNGDTLFEAAVLQRLLESPVQPITLAIDRKPRYDADDMKVKLDRARLLRIAKDLPLAEVDGESIGMLLFRGAGPGLFRATIEQAMRRPRGLKQWYLSVIDEIAQSGQVATCSIEGLQWAEVDFPADLAQATKMVARWPRDWDQQLNASARLA